MFKKKWCLSLVLLFIITGCGKTTRLDIVIALVNDEPIFERELTIFEKVNKICFKGIDDESLSKDEIINKLIERRIVLQKAKKLNISITDKEIEKKLKEISEHFFTEDFKDVLKSNGLTFNEWKKEIKEQTVFEKVILQQVENIEITDNEIKKYYNNNLNNFKYNEMVHAYQILVKTKTEIMEIKKGLENGESFERLAKIKSISPEGEKGGDLGYFTRDEMPQEIVKVVFNLPPNRISDIVKTDYGYHIFKVVDKKKKGIKSLKEAREDIKEKLKLENKNKCFKNWIKELRKESKVKINKNYVEVEE
ncbi:MAG: peptidyl-prolyl cis-trans isomerase [Candidatus Firestonebacteria bacterium]